MDRSADTAGASGACLELRHLSKAFAGIRAVDRVSLDVPAGIFVSLLGPTGSGKTTTLDLIAGFLSPDTGDILLDGRSVADVPPHQRNIGMVFQSCSLFPHMTVADNVGFPLRMRTTLTRAQSRRRIGEILELMQLAHLAARRPRQLSGGQQQRVAMARALVSRPRLLLMDEPLGALDKKLREQMQVEIKRIHRSVGTTVVYVTHDRDEALTMSDIVVLMHQSRIAQVGSPRALYENPASPFVADFLGHSNLLSGRIVETAGAQALVELGNGQVVRARRGEVGAMAGEKTVVLLRPEDMRVGTPAEGQDTVRGCIAEMFYQGDSYRLDVAVGPDRLKVKIPRLSGIGMTLGQEVQITWESDAPRLLPVDDRGAPPTAEP